LSELLLNRFKEIKVLFSVLGTSFSIAESQNNWVLLKRKKKEKKKERNKGGNRIGMKSLLIMINANKNLQ
jgi:hypothetical protein